MIFDSSLPSKHGKRDLPKPHKPCLFLRRQAEANHVNNNNCTDCYNLITTFLHYKAQKCLLVSP